jgi:hypothetical protein
MLLLSISDIDFLWPVKNRFEDTLRDLVGLTFDSVKKHVAAEASVVTAIAQRINPQVKIDASIAWVWRVPLLATHWPLYSVGRSSVYSHSFHLRADDLMAYLLEYWSGLAAGANFPGRTILECLEVIRKDIIVIWDLNDPDLVLPFQNIPVPYI